MMKRAAMGVLVGAVVYFVWGALSWMVIPWHNATIKPLPEETLLTDTMKVVVKEPGFYLFPHTAAARPDGKTWADLHRQGPLGAIVFRPQGGEPMPASLFIKAFVIDVVLAALVMFVLWAAAGRFRTTVHRAHLAAALGILAGAAVHLTYWNWFFFPAGATVVGVLDLAVGFALMGVAMSRFVPDEGETA